MRVNQFTGPLVFAGVFLGISPLSARAELIYGLTTTNSLVTFDSATPGVVSAALTITGLGGGETLFDIDARPANSLLYGFGSAGNLYSINTTTGAATLSASLQGVTLNANTARVGIDFNPTVDRLRIVTDQGQDLRLTPGTSVTTIDTNLNGAANSAVSVAYTNNVATATTTTLFYIGPGTPTPATLYNTTNPNGGVLSLVGALGFNSTQNVGFDISGTSGVAYASLTNVTGSGSSLYTVNLTTGAATLVGAIDTGLTLRGIATAQAPAVPEPGSVALLAGMAITGAGFLVRRKRRARK